MRLTASMFRRRAVLTAPLVVLGPSTPGFAPDGRPTPCVPVSCDDCPTCAPPDDALAVSELQGQLARTQAACLRLAQQLEARYVRYAWTEQLAADLRAIAHDTPPVGG